MANNVKRCSGTAAIRDAQNKATVRGSRTFSEAPPPAEKTVGDGRARPAAPDRARGLSRGHLLQRDGRTAEPGGFSGPA